MKINLLTNQYTHNKFSKSNIKTQRKSAVTIGKKILNNGYGKLALFTATLLPISLYTNYNEHKNLKEEVQNSIFQNIKDKDSEASYNITNNEVLEMKNALKFYKNKQHFYAPDNYNLVEFIKESTQPLSDGGISITKEEEEEFEESEEFLGQ